MQYPYYNNQIEVKDERKYFVWSIINIIWGGLLGLVPIVWSFIPFFLTIKSTSARQILISNIIISVVNFIITIGVVILILYFVGVLTPNDKPNVYSYYGK
jgi:hypothetical protein